MALRWQWDEKCGEAIIKQTLDGETKEFTKTLYEGNAFLIFLSEWEEEGTEKYALYTFLADEEHAKICLGLKKDHAGEKNNMFVDHWGSTLKKLRINKKKCRNWKKIITLFVQAFDNLEIEIYSEE